jgi:hypothetical protein
MQITFKGKAMKIRVDFPTETLKPRRVWSVVKKTLKENTCSPRIRYTATLLFKIPGGIKVFNDKQKLKQYLTTKPSLQNNLERILHTEYKTKHNNKRIRRIKPQEENRQLLKE